jgi:hypothetical protein
MSAAIIQNISFIMVSINIVIMFIFLPIVWLTVGRKFDKLFKKSPILFDPELPIISNFIRAMNYAICIVFKNKSKKDKYAYFAYHGYDFRSNSTRMEIIISFIFVINVIMAMIFLIPWMICNWLY